MTNEQIKQIFLAHGFTEKLQAGGYTDLNPYVYDADRALLAADKPRMTPDFISPPAPSLGKRNKCCCRGRK